MSTIAARSASRRSWPARPTGTAVDRADAAPASATPNRASVRHSKPFLRQHSDVIARLHPEGNQAAGDNEAGSPPGRMSTGPRDSSAAVCGRSAAVRRSAIAHGDRLCPSTCLLHLHHPSRDEPSSGAHQPGGRPCRATKRMVDNTLPGMGCDHTRAPPRSFDGSRSDGVGLREAIHCGWAPRAFRLRRRASWHTQLDSSIAVREVNHERLRSVY